jgi:hypothetical protein
MHLADLLSTDRRWRDDPLFLSEASAEVMLPSPFP